MAEEIRFIGDVERLSLKPGDILVLSTPNRISAEMVERLQDHLKKAFPDHKSIILGEGIKLGVMEPA